MPRPHVLIAGASIAGPSLAFWLHREDLPPGVPRVANPVTGIGIRAFRTVLRICASRPATAPGARMFRPPADEFELPEYSHLERYRAEA
jgi:hypothetical protein